MQENLTETRVTHSDAGNQPNNLGRVSVCDNVYPGKKEKRIRHIRMINVLAIVCVIPYAATTL